MAAAGAALLTLPLLLPAFQLFLLTEVLLFALFALAVNLLFGYTGLLSFGHAAFFGVGGYISALLLVRAHWALPLAVFAGMAGAALAAAVIGFLCVRRDEIYFSMLTLAFSMALYTIAFAWRGFTNGSDGITAVRSPLLRLPGLTLDFSSPYAYYFLVAAACAGSAYLLWRLIRSPFGEILTALRENRERMAFAGVDVRAQQLAAFVVSGLFAGLAGALYTPLERVASPSILYWTQSAAPVLMTILGGARAFLGPALGAAVYIHLENIVIARTQYWNFFFGIVLLALVLGFRGGILGFLQDFFRARRRPAAPAAPWAAVPATSLPSPSPSVAAEVVLEVRDLRRAFGALRAVDGVSLQLERGAIVALIGPNGAGKTTLYNLVTGRLRADDGSVRFRGQELLGLPPHAIARRGLVRSFQITNVFPGLTVLQNVRAALIARHRRTGDWWHPVARDAPLNQEAHAILNRVGLQGVAGRLVSAMPHGDRRVVEIALVLALDPEVVLFDEPTAGLNPEESQRVVALIRDLRHRTGKTFLITEHDLAVVFALAERILVMHQGRLLAQGSPADVQADREVRRAYLGGLTV
jgi:branched-chain amino acid transport system permease protein